MNIWIKDYLPNPFAIDYQYSNEPLDLYTEKEMLKYADWIIKECMRVIEEEQEKLPCDSIYHTGIKDGVWQARDVIVNHFGVES